MILPSETGARMKGSRIVGHERGNGHRLTVRQVELLALVGEGLTNAEVGSRLGITPGTVGLHLTRIYREIGVQNRLAAVRWADRNGIFELAVREDRPEPIAG
jgi:DNA-binding NarL/FixJ family response regulator